jgi:hypothetical protein
MEHVEALCAALETLDVVVRSKDVSETTFTALLRVPEGGNDPRGVEYTVWHELVHSIISAASTATWEQHICRKSAIENGVYGYVWHFMLYAATEDEFVEALQTVTGLATKTEEPAVRLESVPLIGGAGRNVPKDRMGKAPHGGSKLLVGGSRGAEYGATK